MNAPPDITPDMAARVIPGSFPGDLAIVIRRIEEARVAQGPPPEGPPPHGPSPRPPAPDPSGKLAALFVCTQIVLGPAGPPAVPA